MPSVLSAHAASAPNRAARPRVSYAGVPGPTATPQYAVLAAAGYNFRRLLAWLAALWRVFIMPILTAASDAPIPSRQSA